MQTSFPRVRSCVVGVTLLLQPSENLLDELAEFPLRAALAVDEVLAVIPLTGSLTLTAPLSLRRQK